MKNLPAAMLPLLACALAAGLTPRPAGTAVTVGRPLLPDLFPVEASMRQHYLSEEGDRRLLRFPNLIANLGEGPAEIVGKRRSTREPMAAVQVVYDWRGRVVSRTPVGEFEYHEAHRHWHLLSVAAYRLLQLDGTPVAEGTKISFCLMDSVRHAPKLPRSPARKRYPPCPRTRNILSILAGISVGWADLYGAALDGQWVDVTGVPAGDYLLEVEIDPDGLVRERDETNNTVRVPVSLPE